MEYLRDVVIVGGVRTAHGKFKGALFNTPCLLYTSDAADE